jgi:hypothetical protein
LQKMARRCLSHRRGPKAISSRVWLPAGARAAGEWLWVVRGGSRAASILPAGASRKR